MYAVDHNLASLEEERDLLDEYEAGELAVQLDSEEPQEVIRWSLERFGSRVAVCTSFQIDGMAILDMAWRIDPSVRVFAVDTGRMHPETYALIEKVREHYQLDIEIYYPDGTELSQFVTQFGVNAFYRSVPLRLRCCEIRKVRPLLRVLNTLDAWVTGLRRDQWASRSNIRKVEIDHDHGGILKVNPLADWTEEEVWDYIRKHAVPYNTLYDQGYTSIGCTPCTRPTITGEDKRAGRWWWEHNAPKECGMHCPLETGGFEHEAESILGRHGEQHDGH
ncbi:MAG: phosphoadenylyl-sulfate reductase [Chloroflexi bacterium]|nr:phosphoadenylyl-sulfate reductase [Chloroflexota bacterium]